VLPLSEEDKSWRPLFAVSIETYRVWVDPESIWIHDMPVFGGESVEFKPARSVQDVPPSCRQMAMALDSETANCIIATRISSQAAMRERFRRIDRCQKLPSPRRLFDG